jgi:hypothetical protein
MRVATRSALAALCAVLLSGCNIGCIFLPCDGNLDIGVQVKDSSGAALGGVKVAVFGYTGETDQNGCVKITGMYHPASIFRDPRADLHVARAGYKPLDEDKPMHVYDVEVTLQPAGSSLPSAATWTPRAWEDPRSCP